MKKLFLILNIAVIILAISSLVVTGIQWNERVKKEKVHELESLHRIDSLYNAKDENIWK